MYRDWVKLLTSNWSAKPDDGKHNKTLGPAEFFRRFPDEEAARLFLEHRRWGERPACPKCGSEEKQYRQKRGGKEGYYRCNHCALVYTVRTGTFMERSHVPLHK
ncbi:MAG: transposase [Betaproteobacteria bacterium]|nr:transposase [Betaproteobacteria bacterium]